jgi:hypothetical protein
MKKYAFREQIIKDIDRALEKVQKALEAAQEHLDYEAMLTRSGRKAFRVTSAPRGRRQVIPEDQAPSKRKACESQTETGGV